MKGYIDNIRITKGVSRYPGYGIPHLLLLLYIIAMVWLFVSFPKTMIALYTIFLIAMYYLVATTPGDNEQPLSRQTCEKEV